MIKKFTFYFKQIVVEKRNVLKKWIKSVKIQEKGVSGYNQTKLIDNKKPLALRLALYRNRALNYIDSDRRLVTF